MENASKALLIAGSVLIVILIIAVGLRIFNSTKGTTEAAQSTMGTTSATMFNNQFLSYLGDKKSKSELIQLLNKILVNNATSNHKINVVLLDTFNFTENPDTIQEMIQSFNACSIQFYRIVLSKDNPTDNDGYIRQISIDRIIE